MKKRTKSNTAAISDSILSSPIATIAFAILAIIFGCVFAYTSFDSKPVSRSEAIAYSGAFEEYEVSRDYRTICFEDGTTHDVYPHTETQAFQDKMLSLEKGTKLYLLVNPNTWWVAELRTETEELLNFEQSQKDIHNYEKGYIAIGIFVVAGGIFLLGYGIYSMIHQRKEALRMEKKKKKRKNCINDPGIRQADEAVKYRVLLEANPQGYRICYRRVKHINELVVNGIVYDEYKALLEFPHNLSVSLNGHTIEAGLDEYDHSYILLDGQRIIEKRRLI